MTASGTVGLSEKCCLSPSLTNTSAVSSRLDITWVEVGTVIRYTWDTIHRASGTPGHLAPRRGVTLPWPRLRRRTPRATPSATTAMLGARTDMHFAVFDFKHTHDILQLRFEGPHIARLREAHACSVLRCTQATQKCFPPSVSLLTNVGASLLTNVAVRDCARKRK